MLQLSKTQEVSPSPQTVSFQIGGASLLHEWMRVTTLGTAARAETFQRVSKGKGVQGAAVRNLAGTPTCTFMYPSSSSKDSQGG